MPDLSPLITQRIQELLFTLLQTEPDQLPLLLREKPLQLFQLSLVSHQALQVQTEFQVYRHRQTHLVLVFTEQIPEQVGQECSTSTTLRIQLTRLKPPLTEQVEPEDL